MGEVINYSLEKVIEIGVQVGLKTALEAMEKRREEQRKSRYDMRLRNTRLLLKNYRSLVAHCGEAVYSAKGMNVNAVDLLDELEFEAPDESLYIDSIKKSTERTAIIIAHIQKMLGIFRYMSEKSGKSEDWRKYKVIAGLYMEEEKSPQQLAEELFCNVRTLYRDRDDAVKTISALIFGIDGLRMET